MWYRDFLQQVIYKIINPLIKGMIKVGITPNIVTTLGFIGNIVAAVFFIYASRSLLPMHRRRHWGGADSSSSLRACST